MMKVKYFWATLTALLLFSCDDNTGSLGLNLFPDSDKNIKGHLAVYDVTTSSQLSGAVFAKTNVGYLGKFTDPYFGYYEAGFLAQLNCTDSLTFPSVYNAETNPSGIMVEDKSFATELVLTYPIGGYFGDSLTACHLSVYQLDKVLDKASAHYTDIVPENYYNENDPKSLIGQKAYSALDLSVSDSTKALSTYYPAIRISLPNEIGQKILDESRICEKNGTNFAERFKDLFKGVYVKCDYGDGTVLYIDAIELNVAYKFYVKDSLNNIVKKKYETDADGNPVDSILYSARTFAATKEIVQANQFKNNNVKINQRLAETQWTYLKTPAGIYTRAVLPLNQIEKELSSDTINAIKLTLNHYTQDNDYNKYQYSISAPTYVLLIREKDKEEFFEDNKLPDNLTTYLSMHNSGGNNTYTFSNLTRLFMICLAEKKAAKVEAGSSWNEQDWLAANPLWDKVAIIPVLVNYDTSTSQNIISVQNDLQPGYAKLKGGDPENGGQKLQVEVIYTSFNK